MAHSFWSLHYHIVFSTAGRRDLMLQDRLPKMHAYLAGIARNLGGIPIEIGGTVNHVHILTSLPPTVALARAVNAIKSNSSKWAHETYPDMARFAWQEGYSAFSVSKSGLDAVAGYVRGQEEHHRRMSFEEELLALLRKHDIEYDPRYVLD